MPSPLGHALGGVACGWAVARPLAARRALVVQTLLLGALGAAPDLDLLMGHHRGPWHSIGAAAVAATVASLMRWPVADGRWRIWAAVWVAWASHPLLDSLSRDISRPYGIMAYWPFSTVYVQTGLSVFAATSRRWWTRQFFLVNTRAMIRETVILVPICLGVWWARRRRRA